MAISAVRFTIPIPQCTRTNNAPQHQLTTASGNIIMGHPTDIFLSIPDSNLICAICTEELHNSTYIHLHSQHIAFTRGSKTAQSGLGLMRNFFGVCQGIA
eukprot:scaffold5074_cov132-Skeletonema_marinoi.AAC.2